MPVDEGLLRLHATLLEQILPSRFGILIYFGLVRPAAAALAIAAIIRQQHIEAEVMQAQRVFQIVADVAIIAVQIKKRRRVWLTRRNPPGLQLAPVRATSHRNAQLLK